MATIRVRNLTRATLQLPLPHDPVCLTSGKCGCLPGGIAATLIVLPLASVPAPAAVLAAPAVARAVSRRLVAIDGMGAAPAVQPKVQKQEPTPEPQRTDRERRQAKSKHRPK